ncbi:MAG: hypothetical protein J6J61_08040, partial [Muribaculaceae bacterium]|nr:hypothetical protein [Muribaculaceae bacterium]
MGRENDHADCHYGASQHCDLTQEQAEAALVTQEVGDSGNSETQRCGIEPNSASSSELSFAQESRDVDYSVSPEFPQTSDNGGTSSDNAN